jgi:hypothetical protein
MLKAKPGAEFRLYIAIKGDQLCFAQIDACARDMSYKELCEFMLGFPKYDKIHQQNS